MKRLHFTYDMTIEYSETVSNCNFTIKCIPADTLRQSVDNLKITVSPDTPYQWGTDGFRNKYIWGKSVESHTSFRFSIEGDAKTGLSDFEETADMSLAMIFAHPHGLNRAGSGIQHFYENKIQNINTSTSQRVKETADFLFNEMKYVPGSTDVNTSAEEAFSQRCGVCQDYAHILIALLHLSGISARYVTGFIIGEGKSHAWVEFLDRDKWYGIDPVNNKLVNDEYIKIGNGRDARDCTINRGIMRGGGLHTQAVNVNVLEVRKG